MTLKIIDVLDRRHVIPGLTAATKADLLSELAQRAAIALKLPAEDIAAGLAARERLGSTGFGHGSAIPHARVPGLTQVFGLFARLEPAIDFDAVDGERVDLVFLLLTPASAAPAHLAALAAISRRLRDPQAAAHIRSAMNAADIFRVLTG